MCDEVSEIYVNIAQYWQRWPIIVRRVTIVASKFTIRTETMPRLSIILASHNEGDLLLKTVQSCTDTCRGLDFEVLVVDDASTDDSIERLEHSPLDARVHQLESRQGLSPSKDFGASITSGDVLFFLDAHCKPEPGAIGALLSVVDASDGEAIAIPKIVRLNAQNWVNDDSCPGFGFAPRIANDVTK